MKLSKFLSVAVLITFFSIIYVWQQTEIIRLAYLGQKKLALFQDSLDKNSILRYNLKRKTSLINIGNKVTNPDDFHLPGTYCLVKVSPAKDSLIAAGKNPLKKLNLISSIFSVKRQAQAQTVNNRSKFSVEQAQWDLLN